MAHSGQNGKGRKWLKREKGKSLFSLYCLLPFIALWAFMGPSFFVSVSFASDGYSFDPSSRPFSARQLGLGGVGVAFANDANSLFTNTASLANIKFPQLVGSSRKILLEASQYTQAAVAVPTEWGIFGLGYTGLNASGSLPTTRDPANGRIIIDASREAIGNGNNVLSFSYAKKIRPNLAWGASYKIFNQSLSGGFVSQANAAGLDLSAVYKPFNWLTASMNLQNLLEGSLQWSGSGSGDKIGGFYSISCQVNLLGGSWEAIRPNKQKLDVGIDINLPHNRLSSSPTYGLGLEYFPLPKLALRTGFNANGLTWGLGLTSSGFRFDYAFLQQADIPGDSPHYFSLAYVGELITNVYYKLKKKIAGIVLLQPKERFITDQPEIKINFQAKEKRIVEEKTVWTVSALSETFETKELTEEANLPLVYLNGFKFDQTGTIETAVPLQFGRNVLELVAFSTPETVSGRLTAEVSSASTEVKVLRIKPFSDTPLTHWALEPIALNVTLGLVTGYPDESFKPEKGISRAELVALLVRTLPPPQSEEAAAAGKFKDVPANHWAAEFIITGVDKGFVTGYPGNLFKPNKILSRAEGVTIMTRYASLAGETILPAPFADLPENFWANKFIAAAKSGGLLQYLEGKNFAPAADFSRAEACEILYRTPEIRDRVERFWETGIIGEAPPPSFTTTQEIIPLSPPPAKSPTRWF
ncbi:S-layer homology domain-containing protein [Candidatus Saganbacteria bacterium]|nr:S-layer homology domain-containing protein [Candidatus Saganbacteria bacterium]